MLKENHFQLLKFSPPKAEMGVNMSDVKGTASPHIRSKISTSGIMLIVIIALMPATGFGIYNFGLHALYLILVTVGTAILTEYISGMLLKRKITIGDYSAALTGLLLALSLPPGAPLWMGALGSVFAILVVKMLFGGLGQNIINPAMAARCFLFLSFTSIMTSYQTDAYASATPLLALRNGEESRMLDLVIGHTGGSIGETSMIAILVGAVILVMLGVIDLRIPGIYLISFLIFIALFSNNIEPAYLAAHFLSGGLMLSAFFIATDYVTRPSATAGQIIYGILLGFLTAVFRIFGSGVEGTAFAIIIGNLLVPFIDRVCRGSRPVRNRI